MKISDIITALDSGKRKQKQAALSRLFDLAQKRQGQEAIPSLLRLVDNEDEELRGQALHMLHRIDAKSHMDLLESKLSDASPRIRGLCACLLSNSGKKAIGYPVLRALLTSSERAIQQWGKLYASQVPADFSLEKLSPAEARDGASSSGASSGMTVRNIATKFADDIAVEIHHCEGASSPTPLQLQTLELLEHLPKKVVQRVRKELERRLHEIDPDDDADEALELSFLTAVIPPLQQSEFPYFLLAGDSDYDIEHGFACLFRRGTEFCVCSPDLLRAKHGTDDCSAFEAVFRSEPTVKVE